MRRRSRRFGPSVVLASIVLCLSGCASAPPAKSGAAWPKAYTDAINDALDPEPGKVATNLVPIVRSNPMLVWREFADGPRVLMVSLVGDTSYYQGKIGAPYDTGTHDTWVTAVPELRAACAAPGFDRGDLRMRLRQILGLTPTATVTAFVEFWVAAAQLFRPAADNEITDATAGLTLPDNTEAWYREWYNKIRAQLYFQSQTPRHDAYPWTQLGYTYDWGSPAHHQGMSEFVIREHATVIVNAITAVDAYCKTASP